MMTDFFFSLKTEAQKQTEKPNKEKPELAQKRENLTRGGSIIIERKNLKP